MIAANPGPAAHIALLGAAILIALIVYAIVRIRRKREAGQAEELNRIDERERASAARTEEEQ